MRLNNSLNSLAMIKERSERYIKLNNKNFSYVIIIFLIFLFLLVINIGNISNFFADAIIQSVLNAFNSMTNFDRFLFAFTIASHITLVLTSIAFIIIIVIAEFLSIYRNDKYYEILAKRLTPIFTISFGIGTASGIVLAVELVTLFPAFMTLVSQTGAILLFYFEIFAFFLETLFLVLYVYYAKVFKGKWTHFIVGSLIAAGTLLSAVLITGVNAWMNTPNGFDIATFIQSNGKIITGVDPWAPFFTASSFDMISHVLATTVFTGSMMIGGYFAYRLLRYKKLDEKPLLSKGLKLTWIISFVTIIFAVLTGSDSVTMLLKYQPLKYAAIEANMNPGTNLPEKFFELAIPGLQSFLTKLEAGITELPGLAQFPQEYWPPLYVHTTFDFMVLGGMIFVGYFLLSLILLILKKKPFETKFILYLQIFTSVLSYFVYISGWITDEVGRQPWIVYNVMTVEQAANQSTSLIIPGILIMAFYFVILPTTFYFYIRIFNSRKTEAIEVNELK